MHTWRGIRILVIFATMEEKENFLTRSRTNGCAGGRGWDSKNGKD